MSRRAKWVGSMDDRKNDRPTIGERLGQVSVHRGVIGLAVAVLLLFGSCAAIVAGGGGDDPDRPDDVAGITVTPVGNDVSNIATSRDGDPDI
jgi:hypothetical protein